jgi:putative sigma-54 modulation protein
MDMQVRGNGVAIDDDLQAFIDRRAAKLDRLVDRVVEANLELRGQRNRGGPGVTAAQITIQTGRDVIRAEERAADPKLAIDQAFDKLERQVRRVRDKRSRRRTPGQPTIRADFPPEPAIAEPSGERDEEDEEFTGVVRTKRFGLKPMDVEEAIEQMELLGHDFFLFHYADEDIPSVIYRRRDGAYGLLIPK